MNMNDSSAPMASNRRLPEAIVPLTLTQQMVIVNGSISTEQKKGGHMKYFGIFCFVSLLTFCLALGKPV